MRRRGPWHRMHDSSDRAMNWASAASARSLLRLLRLVMIWTVFRGAAVPPLTCSAAQWLFIVLVLARWANYCKTG